MADTDVLLHVLERITAPDVESAPRLKLIQKLGVGVDTIDLEAAKRRGVAVCNMPGANTRAVAELTLLLMLATLRRLTELDAETRMGKGWALDSSVLDDLGELGGRTVGLVGFGSVGKCLAPMLHGVGARVVYTQPPRTPGAARDVRVVPGPPAIGRRRVAACAADARHGGDHQRDDARRDEARVRFSSTPRAAGSSTTTRSIARSPAAVCAAPASMCSMPSRQMARIRCFDCQPSS